ncbi:MAG: hypothetical protein EBR81_03865 [Proteobacteria bacterium]|nr:hypothetical protein [Pseudomonadota bacterium]
MWVSGLVREKFKALTIWFADSNWSEFVEFHSLWHLPEGLSFQLLACGFVSWCCLALPSC